MLPAAGWLLVQGVLPLATLNWIRGREWMDTPFDIYLPTKYILLIIHNKNKLSLCRVIKGYNCECTSAHNQPQTGFWLIAAAPRRQKGNKIGQI